MKTNKLSTTLLPGSLFLFGALLACQAQAATLQIDFDTVFSGVAPSGLTATFEDTAADTVQVTLSASSSIGSSFISAVYLNVDPAINPSSMTYTFVSASPGAIPIGVFNASNCCKADGAGHYDIFLDFSTVSTTRFQQGENVVFNFSLSGLTSSSFAFTSLDGGSKGNYYGAAHIQNTGPDSTDSGWIGALDQPAPPAAVPVPAAAWLLGSGMLGMVGVARRRARIA